MKKRIKDKRIADEKAALEWRPIETAPKDGTFLAAWPGFYLDDDGNLTDRPTGKYFIGMASRHNGVWDEPDALNAVGGEYFGDDWEWGEPTHWQPGPYPPKDAK